MNRHSKFCDQCGNRIPVDGSYPKLCEGGHPIYPNPTPIAVLLVPVQSDGKFGILTGIRGHEPGKGLPGLPGGFMDDTAEGETFAGAAVRELREETGLIVNEENLIHHYEFANPVRSQVLIFYRLSYPLDLDVDFSVGPCEVSDECTALEVAWGPQQLSFGSHTEALRLWFQDRRTYGPLFQAP